jgi:hypothetical protein
MKFIMGPAGKFGLVTTHHQVMSNRTNADKRLKWAVGLNVALALMLLAFVATCAGTLPQVQELETLDKRQLQLFIKAFRTIVLAGFPMFAVAHLCSAILVVSYMRRKLQNCATMQQ